MVIDRVVESRPPTSPKNSKNCSCHCGGQATLSRAVSEILDRLGSSADQWDDRLKRLSQGSLVGRFFATTRQRLRDVAQRLGLKRVPNLGGCPTS